ncbi:Phage lysozyme [compost metagenome]
MNNLSIEEQLIIDEGSRLMMYKDHLGYPTIGIGHLIVKEQLLNDIQIITILNRQVGRLTGGRITAAEQSELFNEDLVLVQKRIASSSFYEAYRRLDNVRKSAIQNLCFQLGVNGVSKFRKMWTCIERQDWKGAYREGLDSTWGKQTPTRAKRVMETLLTGSTAHYPKY